MPAIIINYYRRYYYHSIVLVIIVFFQLVYEYHTITMRILINHIIIGVVYFLAVRDHHCFW